MKEDLCLTCEEVAVELGCGVRCMCPSNSDESLITWKGCSEIGPARLD